ncbi:hypothetical protein HDU90_003672 [Geranomyces variabilis]|nr:hypothetical protein HDU90_003672 [Geranomyces variabilis]
MGTVNILDDILGAEDDELDFDFVESKSNQPEESRPQSQPPPVSKRPSPAPPEARPRREAESEPPSLSIRKVAPSRDADVTRALDARPAARSGEGGDSWRPATRAAGAGNERRDRAADRMRDWDREKERREKEREAALVRDGSRRSSRDSWTAADRMATPRRLSPRRDDDGSRRSRTANRAGHRPRSPRRSLSPSRNLAQSNSITRLDLISTEQRSQENPPIDAPAETRRDVQAGTRSDTSGSRSRPQDHHILDNEKTSGAAQGLSSRTKNAQGVTDKDGLDSAPRAAAEEKGSQQNIATPARLSADWDQRNMRTPDTLPRDTGRPPSRDLRQRDNRDVSQVNSVSSNTKGYISVPRADTLSEPRDQRTVRRAETKDRRTQNRDTGSSKGHMGEPIPLLKDANQGPHEIRPPAPSVPDKSVGPAIPLGVHPERLKAMGLLSTPPPVASPVAQRAYEFKTPPEASSTTRGPSITDRLGPKLPDLNDSTLSGTLKRKRHEEKGAGAADTGEKESRKRSELASDRAPGATGQSKTMSRYFILFYPDRAVQQQSKAMNRVVVNSEIARELRAAFEATRDIILLFIVGDTRSFCGYARMVGSSTADAGPALHLKWEIDCNVHREIVRDKVKVSGGRNPLRFDYDGEEVAEQEGRAIQALLDAEQARGEHVRPTYESLPSGTRSASDRSEPSRSFNREPPQSIVSRAISHSAPQPAAARQPAPAAPAAGQGIHPSRLAQLQSLEAASVPPINRLVNNNHAPRTNALAPKEAVSTPRTIISDPSRIMVRRESGNFVERTSTRAMPDMIRRDRGPFQGGERPARADVRLSPNEQQPRRDEPSRVYRSRESSPPDLRADSRQDPFLPRGGGEPRRPPSPVMLDHDLKGHVMRPEASRHDLYPPLPVEDGPNRSTSAPAQHRGDRLSSPARIHENRRGPAPYPQREAGAKRYHPELEPPRRARVREDLYRPALSNDRYEPRSEDSGRPSLPAKEVGLVRNDGDRGSKMISGSQRDDMLRGAAIPAPRPPPPPPPPPKRSYTGPQGARDVRPVAQQHIASRPPIESRISRPPGPSPAFNPESHSNSLVSHLRDQEGRLGIQEASIAKVQPPSTSREGPQQHPDRVAQYTGAASNGSYRGSDDERRRGPRGGARRR